MQIKNIFHDALKKNYSITKITNHPDPTDLKSIIQTTSQKSKAMLFVFKTIGWGLFIYPDDFDHARVGYAVQAELYNQNTSSKKIW